MNENLFWKAKMRKNEMGEISRTDRSRYLKIRRVLGTELEESKSFSHIWEEEISNPEEVFDRNLEKEYCLKRKTSKVYQKSLSEIIRNLSEILLTTAGGYGGGGG